MKKKNKTPALKHELNRGEIKHCAMAAIVTSPMFKAKTFKSIKGKGSYSRKIKNKKGMEPFRKAA